MEEEKRICGLYLRVSTEDQVREGFSIPEQKERLEAFCKYNDYEIKEYYIDAGISAKTGNHRPKIVTNIFTLLIFIFIINHPSIFSTHGNFATVYYKNLSLLNPVTNLHIF